MYGVTELFNDIKGYYELAVDYAVDYFSTVLIDNVDRERDEEVEREVSVYSDTMIIHESGESDEIYDTDSALTPSTTLTKETMSSLEFPSLSSIVSLTSFSLASTVENLTLDPYPSETLKDTKLKEVGNNFLHLPKKMNLPKLFQGKYDLKLKEDHSLDISETNLPSLEMHWINSENIVDLMANTDTESEAID